MQSELEPSEQKRSANIDVRIETRALESAESHVASSPGTGCPGDASGAGFQESFASLLEWGEAKNLIRDKAHFPFFERKPDGFGDEHEAWYDETVGRWFKATYPNRFGLAWGRDGTATPREYLTRLRLQNTFFWDDIQLVGLANCDAKVRVITSQPHIAGKSAIYQKTEIWLNGLGFCRIGCANGSDSRIAWYLEQNNLLMADAHEGNVIETESGKLVPIDLNLIQPSGELKEWAILNCQNPL